MTSKMLPNQTPYTADELSRLYSLVEDAATAGEMFDADDLEYYADQMRRREVTK